MNIDELTDILEPRKIEEELPTASQNLAAALAPFNRNGYYVTYNSGTTITYNTTTSYVTALWPR